MSDRKTVEYFERLEKKFEENNGKVFLVDYSKSVAMSAVAKLARSRNSRSLFCLVENSASARELAEIFAGVTEGGKTAPRVIDTRDALKAWLEESGVGDRPSDGKVRAAAANAKQNAPILIMTLDDGEGGKALFHKKLSKDMSLGGRFGETDGDANLCVSDLIAMAGYDFVLVDEVYHQIRTEAVGTRRASEFKPGQYELISFLGEEYVCNEENSLARLKKVIQSAKYAMLYASTAAENMTVESFIAPDLLFDPFCYEQMKKKMTSMTNRYEEACEQLYMTVSYCRKEDVVLGECLQRLKGSACRIPADMKEMQTCLRHAISHMSKEELFLRMMDAYARFEAKGKSFNPDEVLENLDIDQSLIARVFCKMLFANPVRDAIESTVTRNRVGDMSATERGALCRVIESYGVLRRAAAFDSSRCRVMRLIRDDSGFEYFVRKHNEIAPTGENCYSILHPGEDAIYKSIALARMLDGRDTVAAIEGPVLAVTSAEPEALCALLKDACPNWTCTCSPSALGNVTKSILVVTYDWLKSTARDLQISSAVFFEPIYRLSLMRNLLFKTQDFGAKQIRILVHYGDLSGHFADRLQKSLLDEAYGALPICNDEVTLENGSKVEYAEIAEDVNEMYAMLRKTDDRKVRRVFSDRMRAIGLKYGFGVDLDRDEVDDDIHFISNLEEAYEAIISNSISVGCEGESIISETYSYEKDEKAKNVREVHATAEAKGVFFNTCTGRLRRTCDVREKNCADCDDYWQYRKNDFNCFREGVEEFLKVATKGVRAMEAKAIQKMGDRVINSSESLTLLISPRQMEEIENRVTPALDAIEEVRRGTDCFFCADYRYAEEIREAVSYVYGTLIEQYYDRIMKFFGQATQSLEHGYTAMAEAAAASAQI